MRAPSANLDADDPRSAGVAKADLERENLGRKLLTVHFDSGEKLIVFAHEIELVSEDLAA